jgi:tetratricopeptide (TPR) repeat protein
MVSFLPASNLFVATGQVLAERTLYVPSIGAVMALGVLLDHAMDSRASARFSPSVLRLGAALAGALLLWSGVRSARWTEHWRNHEKLFARMIAADPKGYAGYWLAGVEASLQKRPREGLVLFEKAFALEQRDRGLILDLGAALTNDGQFDRAERVYRQGLKLAPRDSTLNARLRALEQR